MPSKIFIDAPEATLRLKCAFIKGLAVNNVLYFELFPDPFEPLALRWRPGIAGHDFFDGSIDVIAVGSQRIAQSGFADKADDRPRNIFIGRLPPSRLQVDGSKARQVEH